VTANVRHHSLCKWRFQHEQKPQSTEEEGWSRRQKLMSIGRWHKERSYAHLCTAIITTTSVLRALMVTRQLNIVITSVIGVSITRLSPNFFHKPFETCTHSHIWCMKMLEWYKVAYTIPRYLADHVTPAIEVASRHRLRSSNQHRLIVPRCWLNTCGRPWAFPVAGPMVWNSLPDELRDPACDVDSFKQFFKTILFRFY